MSDFDDEGIPGGPMAARQVHFIWLVDCSGSMAVNGKMNSLNLAIRETIPELRQAAHANPATRLLIRLVAFSSGARWAVAEPTPVEEYVHTDLQSSGSTDLGAAFRLVASELYSPPMPQRALSPVLVLISDGQPTDDWRAGMRALDTSPWGRRATRAAVAVGEDADRQTLQEFLGNPELQPLQANNPRQLRDIIRWASSVAVLRSSVQPAGDNRDGGWQYPSPAAALDVGDDIW